VRARLLTGARLLYLQALGVNKSFAQVRASLENDTRQLGRLPFKSLDEIADKWDFSDVTVTLIASLAGKREGWDELDSSGIGRLGKVIRKEGWIASAGKELTTLEAQVRLPPAFVAVIVSRLLTLAIPLRCAGLEHRRIHAAVDQRRLEDGPGRRAAALLARCSRRQGARRGPQSRLPCVCRLPIDPRPDV
jgi:hypothetical protein